MSRAGPHAPACHWEKGGGRQNAARDPFLRAWRATCGDGVGGGLARLLDGQGKAA